jgi:hypothetical protein
MIKKIWDFIEFAYSWIGPDIKWSPALKAKSIVEKEYLRCVHAASNDLNTLLSSLKKLSLYYFLTGLVVFLLLSQVVNANSFLLRIILVETIISFLVCRYFFWSFEEFIVQSTKYFNWIFVKSNYIMLLSFILFLSYQGYRSLILHGWFLFNDDVIKRFTEGFMRYGIIAMIVGFLIVCVLPFAFGQLFARCIRKIMQRSAKVTDRDQLGYFLRYIGLAMNAFTMIITIIYDYLASHYNLADIYHNLLDI